MAKAQNYIEGVDTTKKNFILGDTAHKTSYAMTSDVITSYVMILYIMMSYKMMSYVMT